MIVWYFLLLVAAGLAALKAQDPWLAGAAFGCVVGSLIVLALDWRDHH